MRKMLNRQWYRLFPSQSILRKVFFIALASVTLSFIICSGSVPSYQTVEQFHEAQDFGDGGYVNRKHDHHHNEVSAEWNVNIPDPRYWSYATDHGDPDYGVPGDVGRPLQEEELRRVWSHAYEMTAR